MSAFINIFFIRVNRANLYEHINTKSVWGLFCQTQYLILLGLPLWRWCLSSICTRLWMRSYRQNWTLITRWHSVWTLCACACWWANCFMTEASSHIPYHLFSSSDCDSFQQKTLIMLVLERFSSTGCTL